MNAIIEICIKMTPKSAMNSLLAKCIRQFCDNNRNSDLPPLKTMLNIDIRQAILDYILRERVVVSAKLVLNLIDGGLYSFDLWQLSDIIELSVEEIIAILNALSCNANSLRSVCLGGSSWIYKKEVVNGALKKLLCSDTMTQLNALKIQQIANANELINIFSSCPSLQKLEISHPSITDRDIAFVEQSLLKCESRYRLRELLLPSSVKSNALLRLLCIFPNICTFKCAPFEQLLQQIELSSDRDSVGQAVNTLSQLKSLTITHPMSFDTINTIVNMCPLLEKLSIEVQEGMQLMPISRLEHLKHIDFRNSSTLPVSYLQQILPVLQLKGKNLESLSLEQFDVIDLNTCARLCPNLMSFSAQWFTILGYNYNRMRPSNFIISSNAVKKPFCNLRYLRLRPRSQRNIPANACDFMLTHAKMLTHIELYCCHELNDARVKELHAKNCLIHLQTLILRHGHNVSEDALNLLLSRSTLLTFVDCGTPPLKKEM